MRATSLMEKWTRFAGLGILVSLRAQRLGRPQTYHNRGPPTRPILIRESTRHSPGTPRSAAVGMTAYFSVYYTPFLHVSDFDTSGLATHPALSKKKEFKNWALIALLKIILVQP